jgi:DNA-binding NarL/FixJ family response regulator
MEIRNRLRTAIKVFVVDDHELLRNGLRALIHTVPNWQVCGEAANHQDAMRGILESDPNVVIVDLALQQSNGLELIKRIKEQYPTMKILVLSMHDERLYAERVLRAGASGFVSKQQSSEEILSAIETVLEGDIYLSEASSKRLLKGAISGERDYSASPISKLSDRELEIFTLIGQGLTTLQIARRLHLSNNTVGTYRERLKIKLNLSRSAELHRAAVEWVLENT